MQSPRPVSPNSWSNKSQRKIIGFQRRCTALIRSLAWLAETMQSLKPISTTSQRQVHTLSGVPFTNQWKTRQSNEQRRTWIRLKWVEIRTFAKSTQIRLSPLNPTTPSHILNTQTRKSSQRRIWNSVFRKAFIKGKVRINEDIQGPRKRVDLMISEFRVRHSQIANCK